MNSGSPDPQWRANRLPSGLYVASLDPRPPDYRDVPAEFLPPRPALVLPSSARSDAPNLLAAPTPEDLELPTPTLSEVFDLVSDLPFEHAMLIVSLLAAEVYHHPTDSERQLSYAADMFPPWVLGRIQAFVAESPNHVVFDQRYLVSLQRVLVVHAAVDTTPPRDLTREEVGYLAGALLGLASALPRAEPPEPVEGTEPDWYAWTSFFAQTTVWYDDPYILEAVARTHAAFAEIASSPELADHHAGTAVDERLKAVYGLDMAEQLGIGLAVAALTKATDAEATVDDRRIQLTRGFLAGGSLAAREAEATALISATREELRDALLATGEDPGKIGWDHSVLERFPVLRLSGDRYRLLSPRALVAWMTRGMHYRLLDAAGAGLAGSAAREARGRFLTYAGALGEEYVRRLMFTSLRYAEASGAIRIHGEVEIYVGRNRMDSPDAAVDALTDVILVEVYSGRMSRQARSDASSDALQDFVRRAIADKLVELASRTHNLIDRQLRYSGMDMTNVRCIWPVLVLAGDAVAPTPLLWGHLRATTPGAFLLDARVQRPIICDLDDLETLLALAEEGRHLPELLADFRDSGLSEFPVRHWIGDTHGVERRPSFLEEQFLRANERVRRVMFGTT